MHTALLQGSQARGLHDQAVLSRGGIPREATPSFHGVDHHPSLRGWGCVGAGSEGWPTALVCCITCFKENVVIVQKIPEKHWLIIVWCFN